MDSMRGVKFIRDAEYFQCPCGYTTTVVDNERLYKLKMTMHKKKCNKGTRQMVLPTLTGFLDKGATVHNLSRGM